MVRISVLGDALKTMYNAEKRGKVSSSGRWRGKEGWDQLLFAAGLLPGCLAGVGLQATGHKHLEVTSGGPQAALELAAACQGTAAAKHPRQQQACGSRAQRQ